MKNLRWFVIGLHLYIFPPDPEMGDFAALENWRPRRMGIWETLKFRWYTRTWSYATGDVSGTREKQDI